MNKQLIVLIIISIIFCSISIANADLDLKTNKEYIHINSTCIISNTEQSLTIPMYLGDNYIGIPLYVGNGSLDIVFSNNPVNGDKISKYNNSISIFRTATYFNGWVGHVEKVEPIIPIVGYKYTRVGNDFNLTIVGTYLPKNNICNMYTFYNYNNHVGTNIIRPKQSDIYD